ncbi:MAG: T9SS type A sorting domain-containing protein [Bacteroidetes bacterium]|nr:T9SS type A sorting domain-containing protein [Bacteroidota bacterium]
MGLPFYNLQNTTQSESITLPANLAGTTRYLIFQFKCNNNNNGTQAPGAIDNVVLTSALPANPGCTTYISPTNASTVCATGQNLSWNAIAAPACGAILYDVYFNAGTTATTLASPNQAGTTYATGALTAGTVYAWQIVPKNGSVAATGCSTFTFTATTPTPGCATYVAPANSSTVCTTGQNLSWNALAAPGCGTIRYDVYFNAGTTATTLASSNQVGTTYATGALVNGTIYAWMIVPRNGAATATGCSTFTFTATTPTPGCATYVAPANNSTVCPVPQTLSWNALAAPGCGSITYDVYFNSGATASTLVSSGQAGTTYNTGALTGGTTYSWRIVPKNGTSLATGCSTFSFTTNSITSSSVAPFTNDFETCSDWTIVNGAQTNQWFQGTATDNGGTQSMYISNTNGSTNAYTNNTASVVHFYKDISFPAGQSCINLTFDWKSDGENNTDYLRVFAIPTSSTPIAGTQVSSGQLGGNFDQQTTWQTTSLTLPAAYAGTTQRLVFSWRNNGNTGNNPPAAVDNIIITTGVPPSPVCATYISPADGSIICPSTQTLSWNAIATPSCGTITYDVYLDPGLTATTVVSAGQAGTTYNATGLSAGVYTWKIVPKNGALSASGCSTFSFTVNGIANDLPCNAVNIALGGIASGDNTCSGNAGEPATPGCWTGGTVNSVWYSFTAPASGNVKIRTAPGTLLNTQIAVYSGVCGVGMSTVTSGCNRNAANCGLVNVLLSEVSLTGLTSGATYYVAVDGENSLVGTFAITIIDAASAYPTTSGQDCSTPNTICTPTVQIGDPGNQGIGFTCDDDGSTNCTTGERGSVWYQITIASSGNLNFNITPNDYVVGTPAAETDYDFVMWKTSGTGATNCTDIASGAAVPVACNYSGLGFSGIYTGGNRPPGNNAVYDNSFEPTIVATAGETYLLLIENYSNSTSGFSLDLTNSDAAVVNYSTSTTIAWTGGANTTTWTASSNWGACNTPSCGIDAIVSVISTYQPLITSAMGTVAVNNFTVDPGAILTLGPNSVLKICGDFTNNGTISADPTSTILFSDDLTHNLYGTFSASSKLGNLTITDAPGGANCSVIANTSIELKGSLTTSNANSIFDLNGQNLLIGGNIVNAAGANTFSNTAGSTITFNGTSAQTYNPNAISATPSLTLNNVIMNHSSTGVSLSTTNTPNMILGTSGVLTLTSGKIITPNAQEVVVMNTALAAVSTGNTTSYVEGNLRRYLGAGAVGLFDFPVGHATPGYERASVDFKTGAAAGAIQLVARFDPWGGSFPLPAIPNWTECSATYDLNYLNHGYWSIDASAASTGLYDLTLYNRGYSNATGSGYSIAKSPSSAPSWTLNGNCVMSPVTSVQRAGMSGFSKMATVQGNTPLPVELISFTGVSEGTYNSVSWKSAVETNFKHYELESSEEGLNFNKIATVNPIGNVSSSNNYNYLDFSAYSPITYYRLKMVDLDYTFEYSDIIAVENGINKTGTLVVFPNPASNELYIKLSVPNEKSATIDIKDILGRVIYQQEIDLTQSINNNYINTTNFASGTYIVSINAGNSLSENIKVIINKN